MVSPLPPRERADWSMLWSSLLLSPWQEGEDNDGFSIATLAITWLSPMNSSLTALTSGTALESLHTGVYMLWVTEHDTSLTFVGVRGNVHSGCHRRSKFAGSRGDSEEGFNMLQIVLPSLHPSFCMVPSHMIGADSFFTSSRTSGLGSVPRVCSSFWSSSSFDEREDHDKNRDSLFTVSLSLWTSKTRSLLLDQVRFRIKISHRGLVSDDSGLRPRKAYVHTYFVAEEANNKPSCDTIAKNAGCNPDMIVKRVRPWVPHPLGFAHLECGTSCCGTWCGEKLLPALSDPCKVSFSAAFGKDQSKRKNKQNLSPVL